MLEQVSIITWEDKLISWGYPKPQKLAPVLLDMGLCPDYFNTPQDLGKHLHSTYPSTRMIPLEWYDPILDFFKWLWEQILLLLGPVVKYVGLIAIGAGITWLASGWYKSLGAIPIAVSVYLMLQDFGVI